MVSRQIDVNLVGFSLYSGEFSQAMHPFGRVRYC